MINSRSLGAIIADIQSLAREDNLACVLVHFNDTYFIDERPPEIPGMARVAGAVRMLRDEVTRATGSDRVLVLHSGDYLSPSAMSQAFLGEPMVEMLRFCDVRFATIGNHEFDFQTSDGDILWQRLAELARCEHLLANLKAPEGHAVSEIAFWPETQPFLAITGIAGEQTEGKALKAGFVPKPGGWRKTVVDVVEKIRKHGGIRLLVVLSHMDRDEDKELQGILGEYWGDYGFAYVLGGHDHDISWTESDQSNSLLSKCLSNCKTITVAAVPSSSLGALFFKDSNFQLPLEREQEMNIDSSPIIREGASGPVTSDRVPAALKECVASYRQINPADAAGAPLPGEPPYSRAELLNAVLHFCRVRTNAASHPDTYFAFERMIRDTFEGYSEYLLSEGVITGQLVADIVDLAASQATEDLRKRVFSLAARGHIEDLPIQPEAARVVTKWMQRLAALKGPDEEVTSFPAKDMDATDASLRTRSTDFGNFVADAIRVATGAQVALINSGAFRIDSRVSSRITINLLRDVFVYDKIGAIMLVRLTADELRTFCDHASNKGGHGAFLQVSESREALATRGGEIDVALVTHMIEDREDGYRALLAEARRVEAPLLEDRLTARCLDATMVDLIADGAAAGVEYSSEVRLIAAFALSPIERTSLDFVQRVDEFLAECALSNLGENAALQFLYEDEEWAYLSPELAVLEGAGGLDRIRQVARNTALFLGGAIRQHHQSSDAGMDTFLKALSKELVGHRRNWEKGVSYIRYLDAFLNPYWRR
jgi:2',3'-cyclic-nucleotide 2'-phosphodiesterase (5'-nucleotidase family)